MLSQLFYKLIYHKQLNFFLRNLNYKTNRLLKTDIRLPPSGKITISTESGKIYLLTNQTSYLTQLLYWDGYKNFEYSEIFEKLCSNISCFLDIGSNIGYYSLLACKAKPSIKSYAFEPAVGPKYFLKKNIIINNFSDSIIPIDTALSDTNGYIDFYEVANKKYRYLKYNLAGEGNAGTKKTSRNFVKNKVKTQTLQSFCTSKNIHSIDLIKIDTEGTEVDILNSGKEIIRKFQPIIICETLYNTIEEELESFFNEINYLFFNHTKNGLKEVSSIKRDKDNGIRNCFFVPKSKINMIQEFIVKE